MAKIAVVVSNPCISDARVIKMIQAAYQNGHKVVVFCTKAANVKAFEYTDGVEYHRFEWKPVPYILNKTFIRYLGYINKKLARFIAIKLVFYLRYSVWAQIFSPYIAAEKPDIIHAHDLICLPAGFKAAQICGAKVVYDAHELEVFRNPPLPILKKIFVSYIEKKYGRKAESIAKYFLSACILEENNTYSWSYFPSPEKMQDKHPPMSQDKGNLLHNIGGEAFYKAGITIEFPIAAYDVNICFSNQDMCRIADTFLKNVFLPNNNLNVYISSNKTRTPEQLPQEAYYYSLYVLISGCSLLDSIRPQIRSKLVSLFGHRPDLFSKGWFSGVAGSMALARFMSKTKYRLDE